MPHFFAAWWEARARREGHTWGKGDPRRLLRRALSTPDLGVRGGTPRVFRCSHAVGERTGRGPRGSSRSTAIPPRAPQPWKGDPDRRPLMPRARLRDDRQRARRPPGRAGSGNVASLPPGEEMWGPRVGDRLGWVVLAGPPIPISRPEGAPPHRDVPGSTTWAAAERDCSACRAAGTRSWGACPKDSQGRIRGRVPRPRTRCLAWFPT